MHGYIADGGHAIANVQGTTPALSADNLDDELVESLRRHYRWRGHCEVTFDHSCGCVFCRHFRHDRTGLWCDVPGIGLGGCWRANERR